MEKSKMCDMHHKMNCPLCEDEQPQTSVVSPSQPAAAVNVAPDFYDTNAVIKPELKLLSPQSQEAKTVSSVSADFAIVCDAISETRTMIGKTKEVMDTLQTKLMELQVRKTELKDKLLEVLGEN